MIKVNDLHKSFGDNEVLKGITTEIDAQEVVCVIGPSGSGKSTFLRCLNRLEDITAGEVIIDGTNIANREVNINIVRQDVGMVFQHFNLFPHKSVMENIMLAPTKLKKAKGENQNQRGMELLKKVGLEDKASAYPSSLSGGQKQRVAIARALAMNLKLCSSMNQRQHLILNLSAMCCK